MKNFLKIFAVFILLVAVVFPSSTLASGNLANGGFETGDFSSWTLGTVDDSANVVTADGYAIPNQGTYMARLGTPNDQFPHSQTHGENTIYQDFVANSPTLNFAYNIFTYDSAPYNHFHYTLKDLDSNTQITSHSQTAWGNGYEGLKSTGWLPIAIDVSSYLGKNLRLEVSVASTHDDFYATWVYVDSAELTYAYCGISQPINADGSSIFKLGSTVPVKFCLKDSGGNFITDANAKIYLTKISDGIVGTDVETSSTSQATTGNDFRYDSVDNQYIFNLATKDLEKGTWQIRIDLGNGTSQTVNISLR